MTKFELKKIFSRPSSKAALLVLLVALILFCGQAASVTWLDAEGNEHHGLRYARQLRTEQKAWSGVLDEELLRKAITENRRIVTSPDWQSRDFTQNDIAYAKMQGFFNIRDLLTYSYASAFRSYDFYASDRVTPDQAPQFYANRVRNLKEWLYSDEAKDMFSEAEKTYLIGQYEAMKTPFKVDYVKGWTSLFEYSPSVILMCTIIVCYLLSGLFSGEFQTKADAIFFSAYHGRNKAVAAKLKAGLVLITVVYWAAWLLYSGYVLFYLGADGAGTVIQSNMDGWKCFYNITHFQKYLLISCGGYVGCLFVGALTMFLSAKTKSPVLAAMIPFVLVFLPNFLDDVAAIRKLRALLPDRLLTVDQALRFFDLYEIGGKVMGSVPIPFVLYSVLIVLLLPVIYQIYRQKRIA